METLKVKYNNKPIYDIILSDNFSDIAGIFSDFMISSRKVCIISDTNVSGFYLNETKNILNNLAGQVDSYIFPAGEKSKNIDTILNIIQLLIEKHYERNDVLVALGGGVVGDMTGFAASIYLRGIKFFQIPTSLLAMVDSSIGGKTGVDYKGYKNMIGAFHMPANVYINVSALKSLPKREYISGFGEIIKHSIIRKRDYFNYLTQNIEGALLKDSEILKKIIFESCKIKQCIVEEDPTEKGIRSHLNFGHTIGHAIEKYYDFSLLHGECVSLGIIVASYISNKRNLLSDNDYKLIYNLLKAYGLPVNIKEIFSYTNKKFDKNEIICISKNDKKSDGNTVKYILTDGIGNVFSDNTVTDEEIFNALDSILS